MTARSELAPYLGRGRLFRHASRAGLADVEPSGRARLDALARWLQDAAIADIADAGLVGNGAWVVRRAIVRVERFPVWDEPLELETFCSGHSRLWAERRTTVRGARGAHAETSAIWVHVEADGSRPRALPDDFLAVYGESAGGRHVKARLRHPDPPPDAAQRPWTFRAADLDLAGHVNNTVYWQVLEEDLVGSPPERAVEAEIEHRSAAGAGPAAVLAARSMRWVVAGDEVLASLALGGAGGGAALSSEARAAGWD